jgi:hypothetical protein
VSELGARRSCLKPSKRKRDGPPASDVTIMHPQHGLGVAHDPTAQLHGARGGDGGVKVYYLALGVVGLDAAKQAVVRVGEPVERGAGGEELTTLRNPTRRDLVYRETIAGGGRDVVPDRRGDRHGDGDVRPAAGPAVRRASNSVGCASGSKLHPASPVPSRRGPKTVVGILSSRW